MTQNYRQTSAPVSSELHPSRGLETSSQSRSGLSKQLSGLRSRRLGAGLGTLLVGAGALVASGCLERPVVDVDPVTSNVFVNQVPINNIAAIDLLFMIDNSTSMADKQVLLKQAVPEMVKRLVTPDCVKRGEDNEVTERVASIPPPMNDPEAEPTCPSGFALEFTPVDDMHIGVITSSIGSHGYAATCDTIGADVDPATGMPKGKDKNDHAWLIPLVRPATGPGTPPKYTLSAAEPFMTWTGNESVDAFNSRFVNHVAAAGETGCGFESQLESVYRFLVEPSPPLSIVVDAKDQAQHMGLDQDLLDQRAAFLRPDSLVAVVALTDENDCSVMEGGKYYPFAPYGHFSMNTSKRMRPPTSTCATNPNDVCCDTCQSKAGNEGCEQVFADSCLTPPPESKPVPDLTVAQDEGQERCYDHQRRFGFDLLFPVERYIDGLTRTKIHDSVTGDEVNNPLFISSATGKTRPADLVFFAGIVGVPWQDLADDATQDDDNKLKYLKTEDLEKPIVGKDFSRWDAILGSPNHQKTSRYCTTENATDGSCGAVPIPPKDPFMVESIEARAPDQAHPIVDAKTTMPGTWNKINGSEQLNADNVPATNKRNDLQYACIFDLRPYKADKDATECLAAGTACDCDQEGILKQRPLCRETETSAPGPAQFWGKAYPGTRILQVLHGIRPSNAIVASICPKVSDNESTESKAFYGYNPAVAAIIDRLADKLRGQCLPRQLEVKDGQVPCAVVETKNGALTGDSLDCNIGGAAGGRKPVDPAVQKAIYDILTRDRACYQEDTPAEDRGPVSCDDYSMCEIQQLSGNDALLCTSNSNASTAGYCYIDPGQLGPNDPNYDAAVTAVASCKANEKRKVNFVTNSGADPVETPTNGTTLFVACIGSAAVKVNPAAPAP